MLASPERLELHYRLGEEVISEPVSLKYGRHAILLAGPPGAGKSTILAEVLGPRRGHYLLIDPDDLKGRLLNEAVEDGSYEAWLKPPEVRNMEALGEKFFPLEMASLVHEESSILASTLRASAIREEANIVVDAVMSTSSKAMLLGHELANAGYTIQIVNVEVPYTLSQQRIRARWRDAYEEALSTGNHLGGRWVPSQVAREVFDGPDGRSKPEAVAESLAEQNPNVLCLQRFRTSDAKGTHHLEVHWTRECKGAPLLQAETTRQCIPTLHPA